MNRDKRWNYMYNLLVQYKEKYGNTEVSQYYITEDGENSGTWVNTQRVFYKNNKLSVDRIEKLRLIGFRLNNNYSDLRWNYMYNLLVQYKDKYGNTEVYQYYITEDGKNLGTWVSAQRQNYKNNTLSNDKIEKLKLIGFRFDISFKNTEKGEFNSRWEYMYNLLIQYKEEYGNTEVPSTYVTSSGDDLGVWVNNQRNFYKKNKLYAEREEKLRLIGFRLDNNDFDMRWEYMYNLLIQYKEKYGDIEVPRMYVTEDGKKLGSWISVQKQNYKNNKLSIDREEKLRLLGFRFEIDLRNGKYDDILCNNEEYYEKSNIPIKIRKR